MSELKSQQIDQFHIIREIGRGGMGVVYLAEEQPINRQVALKLIPLSPGADPKALKRFDRETRATAKLEHPNIVRIYAVGKWEGQPYYTMEYIKGTPLSRLISHTRHGGDSRVWESVLTSDEEGGLPAMFDEATLVVAQEGVEPDDQADHEEVDEAVRPRDRGYYNAIARLIRETAEALDYAHRQGVIHRDIKPANLLLDGSGRIRITDFGLAVQVDDMAVTQAGTLVGTPQYMSPEQLLARRIKIDARTDVYSLGATLYEMLTLTPAFNADTREQLLLKVAVQEPKAPKRLNPHAPRDLAVIAIKAMEKNPDHRYQSAQLMADDLNRFLHNEPILAVPPPVSTQMVKFVRRHKVLSATTAAAVICLAIGAAGVWHVHESRRQARVKVLTAQAEEAEGRGRADEAYGLYREAYGLDRSNTLVAAAVDRIKTNLRAMREAEQRKKREQQAAKKTLEAKAHLEGYRAAARAAQQLRLQIDQTRRDLKGIHPVEDRAAPELLDDKLHSLEDGLTKAERDAAVLFSRSASCLHEALALVPDSKRARQTLAEAYCEALLDAEARGATREAEVFLRLAGVHDDGALADVLKGDGQLVVDTVPPRAKVTLYQYVEEDKRLVPKMVKDLGITPLGPLTVPMGSYLLITEKVEFRRTNCPVLIRRRGEERLRIPLYTDEEIGEDMVYIPPGNCIVGADPDATSPLPTATRWLPGFFIGRTEVTCLEYLEFLNSGSPLAEGHVPSWYPERGAYQPWPKDDEGRYQIPPRIVSGAPVERLCQDNARAYCEWRSEVTGRRFRLPQSVEWEKAARGADGRRFPWGNRNVWNYANTVQPGETYRDRHLAPCGSFPFDVSPYGLFDMAGNVREVCADTLTTQGHVVGKGAKFYNDPLGSDSTRPASRWPIHSARNRQPGVGFRVVCEPPNR